MSTTTNRLLKAEDLFDLPDNQRYELVKGELLTMSPSGEEHGVLCATIAFLLSKHVRANNLGTVYGAESGFKLESNPDTVLAPDAAFISKDRAGIPSKSFRAGSPDLVVEVVSPSDRKSKVEEKTAQWISFGVRAVWLINPQTRTVEIVLADGNRALLHESDELADDEVIRGFRVSVKEIFS